MTATLNASPSLEEQLQKEVARLRLENHPQAQKLLQTPMPFEEKIRRLEAIALLESWITEGDEQEQRETMEFLIKALDEDRLSYRKFFPPELKGISW